MLALSILQTTLAKMVWGTGVMLFVLNVKLIFL